ncbi:MAG: recombinase family protein [Oscillospiraceae bacterium]|nr:recombinase family protein [Oscillospiraceae bacterium]
MSVQQNYKTGIYCRLSVDDGNAGESMSIGNQKAMLTEYVQSQGWSIEEVYADDGWSGTNFDRPNFRRMIGDIERGRINCVVVKDLSRLGRNYILCGQYTEIYFPQKNVRFVALNDGIDSLHSNNDIAPFKNILNDMYAKDISTKVRAALRAKARRGEFLGTHAPYGYLRDPNNKHKLVVNPEVSGHVQRIFDMVTTGHSIHSIRNVLRADGILSPGDYARFRKHDPADGPFAPIYQWDKSTVRNIVRNQHFCGDMVQCRKRIESYRTHKHVRNPREDWVVVEGTHEGIIGRQQWDAAQKILEGRSFRIQNADEPHLFSGLLWCHDCGRKMAHHLRASAGHYYSCGRYRAEGPSACTSHHIKAEVLSELVLRDIQKHAELLGSDTDKAVKRITAATCADEERRLSTAKKELVTQRKRQTEILSHIKKMYEQHLKGKLPEELFQTFLQDYEAENTTLCGSLQTLEDTVRNLESNKADASQFLALLRQHGDLTELTRPVLMTLVNKISISEPPDSFGSNRQQTVRIHYKFVGAHCSGST